MKTIYLENQELTQDKKFTYLDAAVSSSGTTLTVQSIIGFTVNEILCIGEIGQEKTEIIKTHSSTSPSGTTVTLASALVFDHPIDTKVYILDYDQAEFSHSVTLTGAKTVIATIDLQVDQSETQYNDSTYTSGYYFFRFKNSIAPATYSSYSDALPCAGYAYNTPASIKSAALDSVNEKIGDTITNNFLDEMLWKARREYHSSPGKRPFRRIYNYVLSQVTTGMYRIAAPSDLEDPETGKNIYGIRIGTEDNLVYYGKKDWDFDYQNVAHTTVKTAASAGDTSITLSNSGDFEEGGSITIGTQTITYTTNTESTTVLSGIPASGDGAITDSIAADTDVWQNASLSLPQYFTVFDGYIYFDYPISSDYADENIWIDYYQTLTAADSDADNLDEPDPMSDAYIHYLAWCIKYKKDPELQALRDSDFLEWQRLKTLSLQKEYLDTEVNFVPATAWTSDEPT